MWEITPDNAREYLGQIGIPREEIVAIQPLGWGVSNLVLRIVTTRGWYVLKQSRPQLRTKELWRSDPARIFREAHAMQALAPCLPSGVVPRVLHVDRDHYCFLMEHAPPQARVWKAELLSGQIQAQVATFAGQLLGQVHEQTQHHPQFQQEFAERQVFWQLRTDPFYLRIMQRHPDIAPVVETLVQRLDHCSEAICHGDFSPKNLLIWPERPDGLFTLVDYETVCFGDPAMDVGFFLSHLLLKAIRLTWPRTSAWQLPVSNPSAGPDLATSPLPGTVWRQQVFELTQRFWASYRATAPRTCSPEHEHWSRLHCAACMLARVDGTSPVDYLPEEPLRQLVRCFTKSILLQPAPDWENVLHRLDDLLLQQTDSRW
ncbi:Methylthioribose kinase [bacterium HR36]|nr:Methylthioribose kinase [bacterium HR36]